MRTLGGNGPHSGSTQSIEQYPGRPIEETPDSITVVPPNERGFPVSLHVHDSKDREFAVCFDAWHEEFSTAEEALKCFRFGLTEGCRLKARTSWFFRLYTLECQQDGKWIEESTTGYPYFPFLNKRKVEYFQNRVLPANPTVGGTGRKQLVPHRERQAAPEVGCHE